MDKKVKKRKVTKCLTEETIKIAEERSEVKEKGGIEKYKKLRNGQDIGRHIFISRYTRKKI